MSTFVIFLIIIIVIVVVHFAKDSYNESEKVAKEGGIRTKYKMLIDNFADPSSGMHIIKETNKYISLGMTNSAGSINFNFQHTFNQIDVTFEMNNVFVGNHKLNWSFPETMDQNEMIYQIETRTKQYIDNVTSKFN